MSGLKKTLLAIPLLVLALNGCNDDATTNSGPGTLNLAITDAPVDNANFIFIEFTGVELKPSSGNSINIDFASPKRINLLNLQGSTYEWLLDRQTINSGTYSWMRLKVNATQGDTTDSTLIDNTGGIHSLYIPSGSETGLKLNSAFTILGGTTLSLVIDFDLRKSVHSPQGEIADYVLKPSLRLVQTALAGHLFGTVPTSQASDSNCSGAVYLFAGHNASPNDEGSASPNPVSTAQIKLNGASGQYEYEIGFIDRGSYTAAFTCDADNDNPAIDDVIVFLDSANVTIEPGQTSTYHFPIPTP